MSNSNSIEAQYSLEENNQIVININKDKNKKHFFCNICYSVPIIKFITDKIINYTCKCGEILYYTIEEALNPYKSQITENSVDKKEENE